MTLHKQIQNEMREAMKQKDELKLSVLRGLLSAFTNELVANNKKPTEKLDDEAALAVIKRQAKQREDSVAQYTKGGREELAEKEEKELEILKSYLPEMMGRAEIEKVVHAKKEELGVSDPNGKGQLIGAVMKELKGQADGADVKAVVDELLAD